MINKKWIGLFVGLLFGIFIGILPFFATAWPWFILARLGQVLGYRGENHFVIFVAPFFYSVIVAILGFFIGKKFEK